MNYAVKVSPLLPEDGGGFQATIPDFGRGVVGYGETQVEAVADLFAVLPAFLEALKATGQDIPVPAQSRQIGDFSGKFNVRIPKILHAQLVDLADENEVSLNQMVTMLLTNAVTVAMAGGLLEVSETSAASRSARGVIPLVRSAS